MKLLQHPAARQNHDRPQHEGAQHTVHQHPLLVSLRHGKVAEDHQEDKDVVYCEAFLQQVAGQIMDSLFIGNLRGAGGVTHGPPQQAVEHEADDHPDDRPHGGFFGGDCMRALLAQQHEIDKQGDHHDGGKNGPQPSGLG